MRPSPNFYTSEQTSTCIRMNIAFISSLHNNSYRNLPSGTNRGISTFADRLFFAFMHDFIHRCSDAVPGIGYSGISRRLLHMVYETTCGFMQRLCTRLKISEGSRVRGMQPMHSTFPIRLVNRNPTHLSDFLHIIRPL